MSDAKSIARNVASLYIGEIVSQVLTFFLVVSIAKYFGDVGLGKYSFAFSFAAFLLTLADMGLPILVTKEVAKDKSLTKDYMTKTFTLKLMLNIAAFAITIIAIIASRKDYETVMLVILAAIAMFFYNIAGMYRAIFQAYEVMKYESYSRIVERIIAASLGIALFYKGYGIISLFLVLILSNFVYYIVIYILTITKIIKVSLAVDFKFWKQNLMDGIPFWTTNIFLSIYFRIDTIMLGFMKDFAATGLYNAAAKIVEVLTRIPFLLISAVFPTLAKFHRLSYDKTKLLYEKSFYYMVIAALPITTGLILLPERIILQVYSASFKNSIIALQILAVSLVFVFVNYLMGYLLNAIDKQKVFTAIAGITTAFNVILNLALIPAYSYKGAAAATLISEILNFGMLYYFTSKSKFGLNLVKMFAKPMIANISMIGAIIYFRHLHLILLAAVCSVIYFAVLLLVRGVGKDEFNLMKSFIPK